MIDLNNVRNEILNQQAKLPRNQKRQPIKYGFSAEEALEMVKDKMKYLKKAEVPKKVRTPKKLNEKQKEACIQKFLSDYQNAGYVIDNEEAFVKVFGYAAELENYLSFALKKDEKLEYYVQRSPVFDALKPSRFPMIAGYCGTGKTTLARYLGKKFNMLFCDAPMLAMEFTQTGSGMYKWIKENEQKDVIIDDFGAESVGNFYGNKIDLGQVIIQRYNSFKEYKSITIITTNNSLSEIAERYGVRVGERLKEMIFPVILGGKSKRKAFNE